jgi:C-terminal processing protease CtpA/Prc
MDGHFVRALLAPMLILLASHQAGAQSPQDESSKRGYLGVQLMAGALVGSTEPDGPAQAAGIEPGDMIVRFEGKDIKDAAGLSQIVAETPAGKDVDMAVIRGGRRGIITVKLGDQAIHAERAAAGAAKQLSELLKAVALYAVGGVAALEGRKDAASVRLIGQLK